MRTLSNGLRRLLHLVALSTSAAFVRCGEDVKYPDIQVISEVSFEVTGWINDELCYWDCLGRSPVSSGEVDEAKVSGIAVPIFFSRPASGNGNFHISWRDSLYGKAFTTIPVPSPEGFIEFSITKGEIMRSFTVLPIDNNEHTNGFSIRFDIGNITGALHEGTNLEYVLTIIDDEN